MAADFTGNAVHTLNPALVSQRAVQRMPRLVLWLFCAVYVLPGMFGRDPWRNADITAFGYMMSLVRGNASAFAPAIAQVPSDGGLLAYWIGAASIVAFDPWIPAALAARLPFAALLLLTLWLLWYAAFYLARTEAAQPVTFAFGGEAQPVDYARAIADATVLALIASLGLLQLGHETTPELVQLSAVALYLYALAASPFRKAGPRAAIIVALAVLAAGGAPTAAVLLALLGVLLCAPSHYPQARSFVAWILGGGVLAAALATGLYAWEWRLASPSSLKSVIRMLVWFTWPAGPLAAWTVWRWRQHLLHRHIALPLATAVLGIVTSIAMNGSDRALLLALPPLAILAAFALPTLKRNVSAAIDWFSVAFFSICALVAWVIYVAMHTGVPAQPAANVAKLAPGFVPQFQPLALIAALLATGAWLALVQWRAGRHRHPLWKSLVLPAGGVALCWLLAMSLWLPMLNYARSYGPWVQRLSELVPPGQCMAAPNLPRGQLAAIEVSGLWPVFTSPAAETCPWLLIPGSLSPDLPPARPGWDPVGRVNRPTDRDDATLVYRRH